MDNNIERIINSNEIVLFVDNEKAKQSNSFSKQTIEFLSDKNINYRLVPVSKNYPAKSYSQLITKTKWPLLPQLFVNNEFIGGFFVIIEFVLSGELYRMTNKAQYNFLDSRQNNSNQKSIWRIKKKGDDAIFFSTADSKLVETKDDNEEILIENLNNRWINCFEVSQDKKNILYLGSSDSNIYSYDIKRKKIKLFVKNHKRWVNDIKLSMDSKFGFSVCGGGYINKWNTHTGKIENKNKISRKCVWSLDISENLIAVGDSNGDIFILDLFLEKLKTIKDAHRDCITKIHYCDQKKIWLSASYDTDIKVWSNNFNLINIFDKHSTRIWDLDYIYEYNTFISISADMKMHIWDAETFKPIKVITTKFKPVSVCSTNKKISIGGINGEIVFYNLSDIFD